MIRFENISLLEADVDYICHQVNCQGKMNSGVAKSIREKWPIVYEFYQEVCRQHINEGNNKIDLLGKIAPINVDHYVPETHPTPPTVINMFAQNGYGYDGKRYTSYDAFWSCLGHIKEFIPKGSKIAFPYKIGCDRGGANWNVILSMISETLGTDYNITICYLEKDAWIKWAELGGPRTGVK
jgi:O-acetyl-ADP-ribose deacetylase (regulator of RNase III)